MPAPTDPTKHKQWREKLSKHHIGKKLSEEHKKRISNGVRKVKIKKGKFVKCCVCDNEVYKRPYQLGKKRYYCSSECANKVKMSDWIPWNKGKKMPASFSEKLIKAWEKGRHNRIRENCGSWKGGISRYKTEYYKLRKYIKKRDDCKCTVCGITEKESKKKYKFDLCVHHIDGDKKNDLVDNLLTLCTACHTSLHKNKTNGNYNTIRRRDNNICM